MSICDDMSYRHLPSGQIMTTDYNANNAQQANEPIGTASFIQQFQINEFPELF